MFGEILKKLRKEKKMTQAELAELFGYSHVAVVKWENGTREPDIETLIKLADYFGVSVDYLVKGHDGKNEYYEIMNNLTASDNRNIDETKAEGLAKDKSFAEMTKIFGVLTAEDRAMCLGYIVGMLQLRGYDVKNMLQNQE